MHYCRKDGGDSQISEIRVQARKRYVKSTLTEKKCEYYECILPMAMK